MREEQLHVIVVGGTDEAFKIFAADNDADHLWRDVSHIANLQQPHLGFVADAAGNTFGGLRNL